MREAEIRSTALVETDRGTRYAKQLVSHLSRRTGGEWEADAARGWVDIDGSRADVEAAERGVILRVEGPVERVALLEDVVGRHLASFGEKDGLVVRWHRSDGTPGSVQSAARPQ